MASCPRVPYCHVKTENCWATLCLLDLNLGVGMFRVGPFSTSQKLILTLGTSILTVLALIRFVTFVTTGNSEWPWTVWPVVAGVLILIWVRKVPTKEQGQ